MSKKLHAPAYWDESEPLCDRLPEGFKIAQPKQTINCYLCRLKLRKQGQWLNQLLSLGYKTAPFKTRRRKKSRADPRQSNLEDLI